MLVLSKSEELKRKADLEGIFNTMCEIIKLNLNEVNQARKQGAEANCEDVFELFEILVNEIEADLLQGGKHVVDIWRIEGKIKFAFTELEKLNLNNDEDKSKKGNLIRVLSTMHEINKVNLEETRENEQKVYSQPVFNIKVSKGKTKRHAMLESVKFYHFKNCEDYRMFRCSYYESEGCNAQFKANKIIKDGHEELEMSEYNDHEKHNHQDAHIAEVVDKGKQRLKEKLLKSKIGERKKDIYYEFVKEYPKQLAGEGMDVDTFKEHFPTFKVLRQSMWRWQKEILPKAPLTQADVQTNLEYFFSEDGQHLVIGDESDENGKRIISFGTPDDLAWFKHSKRINIDTTFKSAAQPNWASVLICQAKVEDYWAPLTYTLLPSEDENTLKRAFLQIKNAVETKGSGFRFETEVMFDFDETLRNAYKTTIGNEYRHRCRGCSFHFANCITSYVNGKKMMPKYRNKKKNKELHETIQAALGKLL